MEASLILIFIWLIACVSYGIYSVFQGWRTKPKTIKCNHRWLPMSSLGVQHALIFNICKKCREMKYSGIVNFQEETPRKITKKDNVHYVNFKKEN